MSHHQLPCNTLFLDTETSGLDRQSRLCEVAIVSASGEVLHESLIRPNPLPDLTAHISLSGVDFTGAPSLDQVEPRLGQLLSGHTVWSYNAAFDRSILWREWSRLGRPAPHCTWRCAAELVTKITGTRLSLEQAAGFLRIPVEQQLHRALPDAHLLRRVVQRASDHA